jgi:hypothetical protein
MGTDKDQVQVTVEAAMAEKIARLERQVAQLERERDARGDAGEEASPQAYHNK